MVCSFVPKVKVSISAVLRAHACTLAVAMSLNAWWRVPRDASRYGGLAYGLALAAGAGAVAAPAALLQLALGQLCQQGVVGMWRAVPFFTGIGYLRLLITSLSSVYTSIHLALLMTNFFYTLGTQGSFGECAELVISEELSEVSIMNSSVLCYTESVMAPADEEPGHYTAVALLVVAFWILMPFLLYNPVKFMRRIFYVLGPLVFLLVIVVLSCLGVWSDLLSIQKRSDWANFLDPGIWHAAIIQALVSVQVAGGYLASVGDSLYSNTDVQSTTLILVGANVASSWLGLVFWFAIGGSGEKDASLLAVIYQVYYLAEEKQLHKVWPLLIFFTLTLSGVITMLILLYPVYERLQQAGGLRWRALTAAGSALGVAAALAVLAGRLTALHLLEDIALPLLITLATIFEISAFLFIYGWKILVEDVEFLTGKPLSRYWVMGWCVAPGILAPISAWWVAEAVLGDAGWPEPPYTTSTIVATAAAALLVFLICSAVTVAKQVQYDFIAKLKSSFAPSRQWGPRDPITHYYWMMRREEVARGTGARAALRLHLQSEHHPAPATPAVLHRPYPPRQGPDRRTNSDDWFYTTYRRQFLKKSGNGHSNKCKRSKSLDWDIFRNSSFHDIDSEMPIYSEIFKENKKNVVM